MTENIAHQAGRPSFGPAAETVLPRRDFDRAAREITQWEGYAPTPLHSLPALAAEIGVAEVHYKDEGPRFGLGSFKALGGAFAALRVLQREISRRTGQDVSLEDIRTGRCADMVASITLVSATDGNHGRSLAWGCKRFGAPCRIYIHAEVSEGRAQAMRDLGADVVRIDGDYDASVDQCRREADENGWFVVSDTSWPGYTDPPRDVMSGYGVMVKEVVNAMDAAPTHVFLQGGVGGLAAAVAAALRQAWGDAAPRVVVVEPHLAACLFESARQGQAASVDIDEETIMAGLSCGVPSPMAWEVLRSEASDFLAIDDQLIPPTVRRLARPHGSDPAIEAGESGVAGLAALIEAANSPELFQKLGLTPQSRVLTIGSEGVTDPDIYARIIQGDV
ncbi:diaminopropionate ammonia-lyase [Ruegeria sp. HKCCA0235A]|uniref:diaminopropionate ammonia-lyase n=1 Tax=Ruegeria sp. HKCCA0235A TaxID=2682998 RepID=UPI00148792D4|nr:diaminopropionate ammonia-lyase [Ruegeria sp. HKCCA0235A]